MPIINKLPVTLGPKLTPKSPYVDHLETEAPGGTKTVAVQYKGQTPTMEEQVDEKVPPIPADKLVRVTVGGERVVNLGNYESARIHVAITLPCTQETLNDAYAHGLDWVSERIAKETKDAQKAKKGA